MKLISEAKLIALVTAAVVALALSSAQAQITFGATGTSSGAPVDAQATFTYSSSADTLTIILVNLEQDTGQSGQAISGLAFDGLVTTAPLFGTGQLVTVSQGAAPSFGADTSGDLTRWGYGNGGITALTGTQPEQMIFGTPGSDGDYHLNGNGNGVENFDPYVYVSGTFVISNATVSTISDVRFTFGTPDAALAGTLIPSAPVPEASTVVAGALMLLPLGVGAIRALRKERVAAKIL
jgi:hypothetical protein